MLRRVALVRTDVSEELSASIIRVTRIGELGTLAVTRRLLVTYLHIQLYICRCGNVVPDSPILCRPDDRGATFLRNIGSYKSRTV
jgi:hypothetical protein